MAETLPNKAEMVVVGAGAVGCAIAWQLAARGRRDVVVIEKSGITHGSTWHAAGLVGQYRSREDLTRLMLSSVRMMDEIQAETPIDWRPVDSVRVASSAARWQEYRSAEPLARRYGVDFGLLTAAEAQRRFPFLSTSGVHGAALVHGDGYVGPSSLTQAYAGRARQLGVAIREGISVTGFERNEDRCTAVLTDRGRIACKTLVLAPGVWARVVGRMLGLDLPVAAIEHQYAVTEKRADVPRDLPCLRDPDLNFYLKPEVGGFAIGGWEANTVAVHGSDMPASFGRELLPDNLERLQPILEAAARRLPVLEELGLQRIINGPIPVSPDGEPILGPEPSMGNVMLAIGFTSGIAASAGAGRAIAEWIIDGKPGFALPSLDPRRFGKTAWESREMNTRAIRAYAGYYALSQSLAKGTGLQSLP